MAFKKPPPPPLVPDSPEKIILDLPRRKIPSALLHQGEVLRAYAAKATNVTDVAIQLPTGAGKTFVALMIAEWRRRKFGDRIVYLSPTKQLVNQVVEQAEDRFGLTLNAYTGSASNYSQAAKSEYKNADRIAVTTYSSLFNTNPFFSDPDVVIVDDAHASENYIADLWTLRIERQRKEHETLHTAVANLLRPHVGPTAFARLVGEDDERFDHGWVDKLASPTLAEIQNELRTVIDTYVTDLELRHPWRMLRDHLQACHIVTVQGWG